MDKSNKVETKDFLDFRLVVGTTKFEFDHNKEKKNIIKHGYSFTDASNAFSNVIFMCTTLISKAPLFINDEMRQAHMMIYRGIIVHISTTMRKKESVRIISMRKAKKKERAAYNEQIKNPCF